MQEQSHQQQLEEMRKSHELKEQLGSGAAAQPNKAIIS